MDEILDILEGYKAQDVVCLDVGKLSIEFDCMVIASATSTTHAVAIAKNLLDELRHSQYHPIGAEGLEDAQWILVDCNSVLVNIFLPEARAIYRLEDLWSCDTESSQ